MKRYGIFPITGTGTLNDPFRATVQNLAPQGVNSASSIPFKPDNTPKYHFALSIFSAVSLAPVLQLTNAYILPDYPLDATLDGMDADARAGMKQTLEAYDLDGAGLHFDASNIDADSYRAFLNRLGRQLDPTFDVNFSLSCGEAS